MSLTCTFSSFINVFILLCAGTHNSCFALFSYPGPRGFSWFFFISFARRKIKKNLWDQGIIFLTYMCCPWLCSHGGWLLLKCSAIGIGFNGAETNCGIARILGILKMNSCDRRRYIFFSNYYNSYNLLSVYFEVIYSVNLAGKKDTKFSPLSGAGSLSYGVVGRKNRYKESTSKAIVICLCTKLPPGWIDWLVGKIYKRQTDTDRKRWTSKQNGTNYKIQNTKNKNKIDK